MRRRTDNACSVKQINYGSGKDVSDETIADAKGALEIKWYGNSYIDLPVCGDASQVRR